MAYPVGLVGEQHYQGAIRLCCEGEIVRLWHEPTNPFDERAIAVANMMGQTLGYIPRDSFVQRVVHEDGLGCEAAVLGLRENGKGFTEVVIEVSVCDAPICERDFEPR